MLKKLINFLLSSGISQGSYFLVSSLIIYKLGDDFYSEAELYFLVSQIIFITFNFDTSSSITRFRPLISDNWLYKRFVSNLLLLQFGLFVFLSIITFIIGQLIVRIIPSLGYLIYLIPLSFLYYTCNNWILNFFAANSNDIRYRDYQFLSGFVKIVSIILIIYIFKTTNVFYKIIIDLIFLFTILIFFMVKIKPEFDIKYLKNDSKKSLVFTLPLVPYIIFYNLLNYLDQLMIVNYFGKSSMAIYTSGYRLASIFIVINNALINFFFIDFYNNFRNRLLNIQNSYIHIYLNCIVVCLMLVLGEGFIELYTGWSFQKVSQSAKIFKTTVLSYFFLSYFLYYRRHLFFLGKSLKISLIMISAFLINLALNLLFLEDLGYDFASNSTLISFIFLSLISLVFFIKEDKLYALSISFHFMITLIIVLFTYVNDFNFSLSYF